MYAVLGASGHVGSAVVEALRTAGEDVVAVVPSPTSATALFGLDVETRVINVLDTDGLRNVPAKEAACPATVANSFSNGCHTPATAKFSKNELLNALYALE